MQSQISVPLPNKTPFQEYLLAEYQYLAQAHFNTINTISEFFKQYILIVSLPISLAVVFLKPAELRTSGVLEYLQSHPSFPLILLLLIVAVGLGVLGYVVNLRFDALLYARSVNGIRKSFYKASGLNIEDELRFRVLPISTHLPKYVEPHFFFFVVLTFAVFGAAYLYLGLYVYLEAVQGPHFSRAWLWLGTSSCFFVHVLLYWALGSYRENSYLRTRILGVDMDGVLNEHRSHFCELLLSQARKKLRPDEITRIPVHEIPGCSVTRADEQAVFNWPAYWTEMPPVDGAATVIAGLRNICGYKVWVFTERPWPQTSGFPPSDLQRYRNAWREHSRWALFSKWRAIRKISRKWLKTNGFKVDKLVVEVGNADARARSRKRNRFSLAQQRNVRVFVEDDLNNALRLADICEAVLLYDHPYNQATELPNNVVRVTSWQQIGDFVRRIS